MRRVKQRRKWECGLAAAAILTGARYDLLRNRSGKPRRWWAQSKRRRGWEASLTVCLVERHSRLEMADALDSKTLRPLQRQVPALIVLPSRNIKQGRRIVWHAIVWTGHRVLDPTAARRRYRTRWAVERRARWTIEFE